MSIVGGIAQQADAGAELHGSWKEFKVSHLRLASGSQLIRGVRRATVEPTERATALDLESSE